MADLSAGIVADDALMVDQGESTDLFQDPRCVIESEEVMTYRSSGIRNQESTIVDRR